MVNPMVSDAMELVRPLTPKAAADQAGVTDACVRQWCVRFPGLAVRRGGRWQIDREAFNRLLQGEQLQRAEQQHAA